MSFSLFVLARCAFSLFWREFFSFFFGESCTCTEFRVDKKGPNASIAVHFPVFSLDFVWIFQVIFKSGKETWRTPCRRMAFVLGQAMTVIVCAEEAQRKTAPPDLSLSLPLSFSSSSDFLSFSKKKKKRKRKNSNKNV